MKNDEKIDINLTGEVVESELSQEEYFQVNYDTAIRYINIAEHMKQFEDQDKYYHRAIQYLKKINDDKRFTSWINDLRRLKFTARVEGKIALYEEASKIRDTAKTPQDYYSAQTLFLRIAKYEEKHPIPEKWVSAENYEKSLHCTDSAEQADRCEKMAMEVEAQQRRKSLIVSLCMIMLIIAGVLYTRTTSCRQFLATVYNMTGDYTGAYQKYNAVYERSGKTDQAAYNNYIEARYKAAEKAYNDNDLDSAYQDYKAVAEENYKDSREKFFSIEKEYLKTAEVGAITHFANMDWRVLERDDDKIFLLKDKGMGSTPYDESGDNHTWETSSMRVFLNTTFLEEHFYDDEISAIIDTEVKASSNPEYEGVDPGNDTTDKLYLLSIEEVEKYQEQIPHAQTCWWLRTPGAVDGSMAFVYPDKTPMAYGYDVKSTNLTMKPVMWVSLK